MIQNDAQAIATGLEYRAYMPLADRIAARNAAGTPSEAAINGINVKDSKGESATLKFASLKLYLLFIIPFVTGA